MTAHPRAGAGDAAGADSAPGGREPFARLFAMAYRGLVDELHERLSARGWEGVRPAYGFVLLATRDGAQSVTGLSRRLEVSKQAASKLVESMVGAGLLAYAMGGPDSRVKGVALTTRGHDLLAEVEQIHREIDEEWADIVGRTELEQVRATLTRVLRQQHEGALPPVRPGP